MSKLHAPYHADAMHQLDAELEQNEPIAENTYRLRVAVPPIARAVIPGQFVMLRMTGHDAPLIGRALAVYEVVDDDRGNPQWIDLIYLKKGTLTTVLAAAPRGTMVTLWGPLGNGFSNAACDHLVMTAGGIGQTPMLVLGREALGARSFGVPGRERGWCKTVELIYGARRSRLLAGVDDFHAAGFDVSLCTDDGSAGHQALVPDLLADRLKRIAAGRSVRVVTCGPEVMMQRVAEVCQDAGVPCQVSMETPMACGIGICFSCVAKIRQAGPEPWDYKRTCVEGPIFDAEKICW
jgi:dihydroorotate dehydrogenase electron transfer subunit